MHRPLFALLLGLSIASLSAQAAPQRPVTLDDLPAFKDVGNPQLSPDGRWVAYEVSVIDLKADHQVSDIWMTSWDGKTTLQLTRTPKESEHSAQWSPDGRYLAFLSGRGDDDDADQLWLLDRRGGEAEQLTHIKTGIEDYVWSPDGTRLVLQIEDGDSVEVSDLRMLPDSEQVDTIDVHLGAAAKDSEEKKTPKPIVIDRYYFKEDYTGYVRRKRQHLYLFSLVERVVVPLTPGHTDEVNPAWSPDGQYIVFASKRVGTDPDRGNNWNLYVQQAARGSVARQLTTFTGPDGEGSRAAWSPDGRHIAYLQGGADSLIYYAGPRLALIPWGGGGTPTLLTPALDRHVGNVRWSPDGKSLYFTVEDDRTVYLGRVAATGGQVEEVLRGRSIVPDYSLSNDGKVVTLLETPDRPAEVFALDGAAPRALSHQNDSLLATLRLAPYEEITVRSKDGTPINGFLIKPLDYTPGQKYPTILNLHGGPVGQFQNDFNFYWQLLAAQGYAVVAMNPRGSSGRGEKFSLAIWADWGNKDVQDVLAGVDYTVKQGVADPARLGVGGWSYGGMLTNYVIASDTRFKAAVSGASISNILAGFGTDMYVREYTAELGVPWKNTATWLKVSYPFLHADRIKTPTLFLCGENDFNVPLLNSQQMYQALRQLGLDTKLIIYPGQFHGIGKPSYQMHRWGQYLKWYGDHLTP
ncbi:MAG: S9 family peptidase [Gemmatimonadales bacterium]